MRTAGAESKAPPCAQSVEALVLSADALCAEATAKTGPSGATATATLAEARVGVPGLPVVEVSGLTATSTSSCTAEEGSTKLTLKVAGIDVTLGSAETTALNCA
ncbi:hypothetical protein IPZ68_28730 [Streptomyces arenae]|nr:hypothetical protein [Streptomyces arenae]